MVHTIITITVVWCVLSIPFSMAVGRCIRGAGKLATRAEASRGYSQPRHVLR